MMQAIDLPGSGDDQTSAHDVSLEKYAQAIVRNARSFSKSGDIILVGHSMGGAAITAAACLAPELFCKIIYLCAFLPREGESVAILSAESKELGTAGPQTLSNSQMDTLILKPDNILNTFFNDINHDDLTPLLKRFRPQPMQPLLTNLSLTHEFTMLPKAYIVCTQDHAIAPDLQRKMAVRAGIDEIYELNAGHEPFFCCADMLTELLTKPNV